MSLKLVSPFLMWAIVALGFAAVLLLVPHIALFHRNPATIAIFALTIINWLYFFIGATYKNRSAPRSAAAVDHLVTDGVYAKVRHPIYSADILLAWGVFLIIPTLRALLCVAWLTMVLIAWMKVEEAAMQQRFGEQYAAYKRQVPMFIPKLL